MPEDVIEGTIEDLAAKTTMPYVIRRWTSEQEALGESTTIDGVDLEHVPMATLVQIADCLEQRFYDLHTRQEAARQALLPFLASLTASLEEVLHTVQTITPIDAARDNPKDNLKEFSRAKLTPAQKEQVKVSELWMTWAGLMHRCFTLMELQNDLRSELDRRANPWRRW